MKIIILCWQYWKEPAILWGLVAARKGENKSMMVRLICNALRYVDKEVRATRERVDDCEAEVDNWTALYMINSQFTFPKLFQEMEKHDGSMTLVFDEVQSVIAALL